MGQREWGLTVRVSEPALAHDGAMPHAPCHKILHYAWYKYLRKAIIIWKKSANTVSCAIRLSGVGIGRRNRYIL